MSVSILPLQAVNRDVDLASYNQVISVMPPDDYDSEGMFRRPFIPAHVLHNEFHMYDICVCEHDLSYGRIQEWMGGWDNPEYIPNLNSVSALIECLKKAHHGLTSNPDYKLIIHCHGGVSRSVGAGWILAYLINRTTQEDVLIKQLQEWIYCPELIPTPNPFIVMIADHILNLDGNLLTSCLNTIKRG